MPRPEPEPPRAGAPRAPDPRQGRPSLARAAAWLAALGCRRPRSAALLLLGLGALAAVHVARDFRLDTDTATLLTNRTAYRQGELRAEADFPQRARIIAAVVDGTTAAAAERGAAALAAALLARGDLFISVHRPDGGPFFARNGLLFLPAARVAAITEQAIAAQPLLGTLAADPSARGVAGALDLLAEGASRGQAPPGALAAPLRALADAAEAAARGPAPPLDWDGLLGGGAPDPRALRRFVLARPRLDFAALSPGAAATQAVRDDARRLGLTPGNGVRVRLTGPVPIYDEEFATVAEGAWVNTLLSIGLVALVLWAALRSWRLIVPVLLTLLAGLAITGALGLLFFGAFNPLSVAFTVLFVGLGVDFGLQYAVRYREARHRLGGPRPNAPGSGDPAADAPVADALRPALAAAAREAGPGMILAAAAVAIGFLAFLPTDYRGVSELGLIAGCGMGVALLLSLTLLPALLLLLRPEAEALEVGFPRLAALDRLLNRRAGAVALLAGLAALGALALLPRVPFDFDPVTLRSPRAESVSTYLDLARDPLTSPYALDAMAPDEAAAAALAVRAAALPEVAMAVTLGSFIPENQEEKLALIADAALLLGPTLSPDAAAPPTDAEVARALAATAARLDALAATPAGAALGPNAGRLAAAFRALAANGADGRARLDAALVPGLRGTLAQLRDALSAGPVTRADLPPELVRDWEAPDGRVRVAIHPSGGSDEASLRRFADAVRALAPDATGAPVSIEGATATIQRAFLVAGALALAGVALLLWAVLRSARWVAVALAPLLLAGLGVLATCALVGPALNLANLVALPLLFGIGVAFDIYYVVAWRAGARHLLPSALTRAVVFSALTTGSAFGTLALSPHPGTASMGVLLVISLFWTLAAVLLVLPALLRLASSPQGAPPPAPAPGTPSSPDFPSAGAGLPAGAGVTSTA